MVKSTSILLLLACSATAVAAQTVDPTIEQISRGPAQVEVDSSEPARARSTEAPSQLTSGADSSSAASQVTRERRVEPAPEQLSKGGKTAQSPQPLSKPADGRQSAVERVAGTDQCDPADPKRSRAKCATVIENRASEFARTNANELSPEQRLLLEQEIREGALSTQKAARKLAATGRAESSLEAMGVAATALRPTEVTPENTEVNEDAARAAEIVGAILNAPLTPPQ